MEDPKTNEYFLPTKETYFVASKNNLLVYNKKNFKAVLIKNNKLSSKNKLDFFKIQKINNHKNNKINNIIKILLNKRFISIKTTNREEIESKIIQTKTKPVLSRVMIEITNGCNLNCAHCYVRNRRFKISRINTQKLMQIIKELEKIGVWQLDLTGGEMYTHPGIKKILRRLSRSNILVNLFTNLAYKDNGFIKDIIKLKPKLVITSIDGSCDSIHDRFRGKKGAFNLTFRNIKLLKRANIPLRANVILSKNNAKDIKDIVKVLELLKIPFIVDDISCEDKMCNIFKLDDKKTEKLIYKYQKNLYLKRLEDKIVSPKHTICGVGFDFLFINSEGEISLCPTLTRFENKKFYAGNIYKNNIKTIWEESVIFRRYRNLHCKDYGKYPYCNICSGGCRSRAYNKTNDVKGKDSLVCHLSKKIYDEN